MARKLMIAGNWKMNKTANEGKALVEELKNAVADICPCKVDIIVCPPFTTLTSVLEAAKGSNIKVGAQNIHWAESGAFTGEISGAMLKELGVEYVIIGHSERRQYFGEPDETVNKRLKAALANDLKPIVCIGEMLEERESGKTNDVLATQLAGGLADISAADMEKIVIAYEPVWAIGTGKTATPEVAEETHKYIRSFLTDKYGKEVADKIVIQYGGSMNDGNAEALVSQADIDGGLIGGASLVAAKFTALINNALKGSAC